MTERPLLKQHQIHYSQGLGCGHVFLIQPSTLAKSQKWIYLPHEERKGTYLILRGKVLS